MQPKTALSKTVRILAALMVALATVLPTVVVAAPAATPTAAPLAQPEAPNATYTFTTTPAGNITDTGVIPDGANYCDDLGWPNTRYFLVNDHFNVTDLNVRFNAQHEARGQVRVILTSPPDASGVTVQRTIVPLTGDTNENYDILLDADVSPAASYPLDDGNDDNTGGSVDRSVYQALLNDFDNRDARGAWRMDICDGTDDNNTGALVLATLYFTGDPITFPAPTFSQGPAILETYFIPMPENEFWTSAGTLFYPGRSAANGDTTVQATCLDYSSVNANPRQPIIGFTGVTIAKPNTIVYFDHWEDGYEPVINYPTQPTTEVWGDSILTNGRAPGDSDDLLVAGQLVTLNDVKDSTAAEVVDYDGRDKFAATNPVAVTRALWANGSTTLFAAADEIYPTSDWGSNYLLPVGETSNTTYDYFQYTGVSVLAAANNTVVHIDRDNNGTDEMTCTLNQGQTCQWDDKSNSSGIMGVNNVIGNGLLVGSRIYTDGGKKIQVSLLTGDVCEGYETRAYSLHPTTAWSNQYYAPVSSSQNSRTIGSVTNTMPTMVRLYNPGPGSLTVNWTFGSGGTGSQSISANGTHDVLMPNNDAARFYATGNFYAVGTVDANTGSDYSGGAADWGYTLVPVTSMSQHLIVGWAPGSDPNIPNSNEDTAPIWLTGGHTATPASTTPFTVCIDEGGDGGANLDPNTGRYYDRTITVTPFQQQIVYDQRSGVYGETGMQLWVCDAVNGVDAVITAAWGEDPDTISTFGKPTMDMGFTIRNLGAWNILKGASLWNDVNGNGLYDEGDTVRFTITVNNTGSTIPANTLNVTDQLPAGFTYVPNSSWVVYHDATPNLNLTDGVNTPLDPGGYTYTVNLPPAESFQVYFDVTIDFDTGGSTLCNLATGDNGVQEQGAEACVRIQEPVLSAIGNYVWFDEDGDGDQDAGEAGIPNVRVELWEDTDGDGSYDTLVATTYTDANGGYLFPGLDAGQYRVDVIASSLPDPDGAGPGGLHQTYDENGLGTPHSTTVSLGAGVEHMTADFGYNWAPPGDTNNPPAGATGAIGDRVWIDTDGDGVQDTGEAGIPNVTVELWYDSDNDGVIDAIWPVNGSTTTNASGNYIFDQLPPGIYEVRIPTPPAGYTQTGDPDNFGAPCGTACDNRTTTPIVLGPGDVFLNADFGYQPSDAQNNSIGSMVWFDADADGVGPVGAPGGTDTDEFGIPGVTVALISDLNNNGIWDPDEPIIATEITDANGNYLFTGLPDGSYLVWVNDTEHVLGEVTPTYDSNGGTAPTNSSAPTGVHSNTQLGISSVLNLGVGDSSPATNLDQDFGYTALGQTPGQGAIGDTVFLDANNDGDFDPGEGLEGVVVVLYDNNGVKLAVTTTDENGHYYFGGLDPNNMTYVVQVQTNTLPNNGVGLTNHVDPDGGGNSFSTVTLTPSAPINLDQDFGYRPTTNPGSIGNFIWEDSNADGNVDPGENGIAGVTVDLYEDTNGNGILDGGDHLVGQTVTDSNGGYLFSNLPPGNYLVDVSDDAGVLNGYWHSQGTPGADNNSQTDPHPVNLAAGQNYVAADFGYYVEPAAVGNRIWNDVNQNGIQDAGEPGLNGIEVTLTILYPNGDTTVLTVVTANDPVSGAPGWYSFGNLLQDEDYNGDGNGPEPVYTISVDITQPALAGWNVTHLNQGGNDQTDADNPAGVVAQAVQGQTNTLFSNDNAPNASFDFGFTNSTLAVLLASFDATSQADHVLVTWETVSEANNAGFNLYRGLSADGPYTLLDFVPSASPGGTAGAAYSYQDFDVAAGQTIWYQMEDIALSGAATMHGPVSVLYQAPTAVTLNSVQADGGQTGSTALALLAGLLAAAGAVLVYRRRNAAA